jgi:hypothetical protein
MGNPEEVLMEENKELLTSLIVERVLARVDWATK